MTAHEVSVTELYPPPHPLILLRDEARVLQADAKRFAENVEAWMDLQFAGTEERHQYAEDGAA